MAAFLLSKKTNKSSFNLFALSNFATILNKYMIYPIIFFVF